MARESIFSVREARAAAWVVAVAAVLTAIGFSGLPLGQPSIPDRGAVDQTVVEAQPLAAVDLGLG